MSGSNGKTRYESAPTSTFYTTAEGRLSGGGDTCSESDLSSTDSSSFQSDFSEEEEWEQEVSAKGELFFVRPQQDKDEGDDNNATKQSQEQAKWTRAGEVANGSRKGLEVTEATVKEIVVAVNQRQSSFGRRSSPLEALLGIVPTWIRTTVGEEGGNSADNTAVVVQALVPGSEAIKNKDILIGDWISKINDVDVTWANLDQVVSAAASVQPKQVKLTLRSQAASRKSSPSANKLAETNSKSSQLLFPKLLSGNDERWTRLTSGLAASPHIALYLTLATSENSDPKGDILFQFPHLSNKLVDIRGALLTINHLMPDAVGSEPISSSVVIGSNIVHVSYAREGKEVLLLALPGECISSIQIFHLINAIVRALKYQYGSLHEAFTGESNRMNVDHLFASMFVAYLQNDETSKNADFSKHLNVAQRLPFLSDLQCEIDRTLTEFESADFADMSEDHYDMRRLYTILGTCLFYKGFLVGSHLPKDDLEDVFLYLQFMGLLEISIKSLTMKAVVWREVFPSKLRENAAQQTRWFLLVVGQNYSLMGVLLEAGGCASKATGVQGPDPFYVEQAQTTLLQLEVQQVTKSIELWLQVPQAPSVVSADSFLSQNKRRDSGSLRTNEKPLNQAAKKGLNASILSLGALSNRQQGQTEAIGSLPTKEQQTQGGETDSDSTSLSLTASGTSDDTTPILGRRGKNTPRQGSWSDADSQDDDPQQQKATSSQRYLPSLLDLTAMTENLPVLARERNAPPPKLTGGFPNVLFHYLQVNSADGVLICPTSDANAGTLYAEVIANFRSSCLIIRKMLRYCSSNDSNMGSSNQNVHFGPFVEHGMLFKCQPAVKADSSREVESLSYWVVGRMFLHPHQREVYVCHHDSCPQTMVEIAFQLSFGLTF